MLAPLAVSLSDIQDAAKRIGRYIVATPLLEAPLLDQALGFRLLLKAESVQLAGAFKARGAFNQVLQLTDEEKRRGVMAVSTGNHAQAVALAATTFGVKSTILMPADAPRLKLENTRAYGAEVVTYDRASGDREALGREMAEKRGLRMIHPYNDARTIAGQGTAGLEIYAQTQAKQIKPDALVIPCSGGGLAGGIATTRDLFDKPPALFTAEPAEFDDVKRSLAAGHAVKNEKQSGTICDALTAVTPGTNTLPILMHHKAVGFAASDAEVEAAISLAQEYFKLALEPGGAVGLASACLNRAQFKGQTVVVVASGGNADPDRYAEMLVRGRANRRLLLA